MLTRDILPLITSKCSNTVLEKLSHTALWQDISTFASEHYFWHLRVQHLVGASVKFNSQVSPDMWKNTYYSLSPVIKSEHPLLTVNTLDHHAIKILIDLGHDPSGDDNIVFITAIMNGHLETVKLLLTDHRINPNLLGLEGEDALLLACGAGCTEVVKLLLSSPRVDPIVEGVCLYLLEAVVNNRVEVVDLLLLDGRFNPEYILIDACSGSNVEIVRNLLEDPRVDPTEEDNAAIAEACSVGCIEVIKILLQDDRIDPAVNDNEPLIAASGRGTTEVVNLLLSYPGVVPTLDALNQAAYHGNSRVVRTLLERSNLVPDEVTLYNSIKSNNSGLISLVLKRVPEDINFDFGLALLEVTQLDLVESAAALLLDERVDSLKIALTMACQHGSIGVAKLLLADIRIDLDIGELIRVAILGGRGGIVNLLLQDSRVDLDSIAQNDNFRKLVCMVLPYIHKNAVGLCMYVRDLAPPSYQSLARLLILRRLTHSEVVEWMLLHQDNELAGAAREFLLGDRIDTSSDLSVAYRGFLMLFIVGENLEFVRTQLRVVGASQRGIDLASGLIAAYLGVDSPLDRESFSANCESMCRLLE